MLASIKCHQLARTLYSISNKIPYEDVQTTSTQLAQCASNVLSVRTDCPYRKMIVCICRRSMVHYNNERMC